MLNYFKLGYSRK